MLVCCSEGPRKKREKNKPATGYMRDIALRTGVGEYGICVRTASLPPFQKRAVGRTRQRESSKNGANEHLSQQTADLCEAAKLLMREEKTERDAIR